MRLRRTRWDAEDPGVAGGAKEATDILFTENSAWEGREQRSADEDVK